MSLDTNLPPKISTILERVKYRKIKNGKNWTIDWRYKGNRYTQSTRTEDLALAKIRAPKLIARKLGMCVAQLRDYKEDPRLTRILTEESWAQEIKACERNKNNWLGYMHQRAKDRSRRRGVGIDLTYEQLVLAAYRSNGACGVTGIKFDWDREEYTIPPYAPCLDRIDSSKGYTKNNVRLVCNCVNTAMGQWGEVVLFKMAEALII